MMLHLGDSCMVFHRHILAILDLRTAEGAGTRAFFERARAQHTLVTVPEGAPRSAVITVDDAGTCRVYLSPISALALKGRRLADL